jgi:CBS domain-containing protein
MATTAPPSAVAPLERTAAFGRKTRHGTIEPLRVRDVMTRRVITTSPDATLLDAADLLREYQISGLPVLWETAVVGVLSEKDIARFVLTRVGRSQLPSYLLGLFGEVSADRAGRTLREIRGVLTSTPVAEAMSPRAVIVPSESLVDDAAQTMIDRRIHRLPVVDRGQLVGILSRHDVLRFAAGHLAGDLD